MKREGYAGFWSLSPHYSGATGRIGDYASLDIPGRPKSAGRSASDGGMFFVPINLSCMRMDGGDGEGEPDDAAVRLRIGLKNLRI